MDFNPSYESGIVREYADTALDLLLKDRLTKFLTRATHIYDGMSFTKNALFGASQPSKGSMDFTVSWIYSMRENVTQKKEMNIVGSNKTYPRISMSPNGYVKLTVIDPANDALVTYSLKHSYRAGRHTLFSLVKQNGDLCLFQYETLVSKQRMELSYRDWDKDGHELIGVGGYYTGAGEPVYNAGLFIQIGAPRYNCSNVSEGGRIDLKSDMMLAPLY